MNKHSPEELRAGIEAWEKAHQDRLKNDPIYRSRHEALEELTKQAQELGLYE